MIRILGLFSLSLVLFLSGCADTTKYDYSKFRSNRPKSILILPPVNQSLEENAGASVAAQAAFPLAEAGYYVYPVAVVEETFKNNGYTVAEDIHSIEHRKLYDVFGADSALYLTVTAYGTSYRVISSVTEVAVSAVLVDLRTGDELWKGMVHTTNDAQKNQSGGLIGMLIGAAVSQIVNTMTDNGFEVANLANQRLLSGGLHNGILYGPRSEHYNSEVF